MAELIEIPSLPELTFSTEGHVYRLNGDTIPSVTTLMEPLSLHEYGGIDEQTLHNAANKGTAVHNAIENWIKFGFDDLTPEFHGYMDGFLAWWDAKKPDVIGSEIRTYHRLMQYAGTVDLVAVIDGEVSLIDFKTTYKLVEKNCRVQLEAYSQAMASHGIEVKKKVILHLRKDGGWQEYSFPAKDREAWTVFGSLKCIHDFLTKK